MHEVKATTFSEWKIGSTQKNVVEMPGGKPRIVRHVDIAGEHFVDGTPSALTDRRGHRVDVARRAGDRLCEHAALLVEHTG